MFLAQGSQGLKKIQGGQSGAYSSGWCPSMGLLGKGWLPPWEELGCGEQHWHRGLRSLSPSGAGDLPIAMSASLLLRAGSGAPGLKEPLTDVPLAEPGLWASVLTSTILSEILLLLEASPFPR